MPRSATLAAARGASFYKARVALIHSSRWLPILLIPLAACTSTPPQGGADAAQMQLEAAREVRRVCDLPAAEREAELKKIRSESDIEVFCGNE